MSVDALTLMLVNYLENNTKDEIVLNLCAEIRQAWEDDKTE